MLDEKKKVHAYGVVTDQSAVDGCAVPPGYLAVNVTTVLRGCTLLPTMENPVGKELEVIKEAGNYIWPMTRLALPSHLRPVSSTQ